MQAKKQAKNVIKFSKTLRSKKRYLLYELKHGDNKVNLYREIVLSFKRWFGMFDYSNAGMMNIVRGKKSGIIKINTPFLSKLKYSVSSISQIDGQRVLIIPTYVSGILRKVKQKGGF